MDRDTASCIADSLHLVGKVDHCLARSRYEARTSELLPSASRSASVAISRHLAMRCSRERLMNPPASNSRMIVESFIAVRPTADTLFSFRVAFASAATFVLVHSRQHNRKAGASISRFRAPSSSRHRLALPLSQRDGFASRNLAQGTRRRVGRYERPSRTRQVTAVWRAPPNLLDHVRHGARAGRCRSRIRSSRRWRAA